MLSSRRTRLLLRPSFVVHDPRLRDATLVRRLWVSVLPLRLGFMVVDPAAGSGERLLSVVLVISSFNWRSEERADE